MSCCCVSRKAFSQVIDWHASYVLRGNGGQKCVRQKGSCNSVTIQATLWSGKNPPNFIKENVTYRQHGRDFTEGDNTIKWITLHMQNRTWSYCSYREVLSSLMHAAGSQREPNFTHHGGHTQWRGSSGSGCHRYRPRPWTCIAPCVLLHSMHYAKVSTKHRIQRPNIIGWLCCKGQVRFPRWSSRVTDQETNIEAWGNKQLNIDRFFTCKKINK